MEDAHWADEATLDLLVFLGRRLERTRALLIITYRDDELGADHPLRGVLVPCPRGWWTACGRGRCPGWRWRSWPGGPVGRRRAAGSDRREPAAGHRGAGRRRCRRALTVRDLVLARLARLPVAAQEVVRLVAVVPTRTELWLLEEALGPEPAAVERCVAAGLLVVGEAAVGFRHELLRQAVEGSLSTLGRRELHARVLGVLSEAQGRGVDIARLVHHARQADDADAVLRYAPQAARQAAAVSAHREAVGHYQAALASADRLSPPVRAELLEGYSIQAYLSGLAQEALDARQAALRIREAEPAAPSSSARACAGCRACPGGLATGRRRRRRRPAPSPSSRVPNPAGSSPWPTATSPSSTCSPTAPRRRWPGGRAIELARRLGDPETLSHALTNIGTARLLTGDQRGRADLEQAFAVAVAAGLEDHAARALVCLAGSSVEMRDYRHAREDLDRALGFAVQHDLAGYSQHLTGVRAGLRLDQGDWAGAEQDARAALAEGEPRRQPGTVAVEALVALGRLQARRGDPDACGTLEEAATRAFPKRGAAVDRTGSRGPRRARLAGWQPGPHRDRGRHRVRAGRAGRSPLACRRAGLLAVAGRGAARGPGGGRRTVPAAAGRRLASGRRRLARAGLSLSAGAGARRRRHRGLPAGAEVAGRPGRQPGGPAAAPPAPSARCPAHPARARAGRPRPTRPG